MNNIINNYLRILWEDEKIIIASVGFFCVGKKKSNLVPMPTLIKHPKCCDGHIDGKQRDMNKIDPVIAVCRGEIALR